MFLSPWIIVTTLACLALALYRMKRLGHRVEYLRAKVKALEDQLASWPAIVFNEISTGTEDAIHPCIVALELWFSMLQSATAANSGSVIIDVFERHRGHTTFLFITVISLPMQVKIEKFTIKPNTATEYQSLVIEFAILQAISQMVGKIGKITNV